MKFWSKQAPATIFGVIVITIVGSLLYDLLVKPGLSSFGRLFMEFMTLGSITLKDSAYVSAALDPTPLTGLFLLIAATSVATFPVMQLVTSGIVSRHKQKSKEEIDNAAPEHKESAIKLQTEKLEKKRKVLRMAIWMIFIPWLLMVLVATSVHSQSILIWRVFHADLELLAPHIEEHTSRELVAQFRAIQTSNDYVAMRAKMKRIAGERDVKLTNIEIW